LIRFPIDFRFGLAREELLLGVIGHIAKARPLDLAWVGKEQGPLTKRLSTSISACCLSAFKNRRPARELLP
jgi:hypothetical protein